MKMRQGSFFFFFSKHFHRFLPFGAVCYIALKAVDVASQGLIHDLWPDTHVLLDRPTNENKQGGWQTYNM